MATNTPATNFAPAWHSYEVNMRAEFMLLPFATLAIVAPAHATVFLSVEKAQALMFPGASFTPEFRTLANEQATAIQKVTGVNVRTRELRVWQVSTGGWFIVDEVIGKHELIPFALGLDANGAVKAVEILEYREAYGSEIRNSGWRKQFTGKKHGALLRLTRDIQNITGATMSSRHITDGIKRLLATYVFVIAQD